MLQTRYVNCTPAVTVLPLHYYRKIYCKKIAKNDACEETEGLLYVPGVAD